MHRPLHDLVDVWRVPDQSADRQAIAFADAAQTWQEKSADCVMRVELLMKTFDTD
ncbi:hypothetical protein [Streptomyces chartreusis]